MAYILNKFLRCKKLTKVIESKRRYIVSYLALAVSLGIAILSVLSLVFPALIVSLTTEFPDETVDPFEFGAYFPYFLIANLIILGIFILYHTKKLPTIIVKSIKFIFNFEVSKQVSLFVILGLLSLYIGLSIHELFEEEIWPDFFNVKDVLSSWPFATASDSPLAQGLIDYHVRYALLMVSQNFFPTINFVPFFGSISLLLLTYFFTVQITKKRFAGLISMTILLQSQTFLDFDTSPTYTTFWTLFYLLSLYLITKRWQFSSITFVLSLFSKALTALFLPFSLFFIYRANISRKQKILTALSYGVIIVIGAIAIFGLEDEPLGLASRDYSDINNLWRGFAVFGFLFRSDLIFIIFLLPLMFGLFILSRKGMVLADAVMLLVVGVLLSAPLSVFGGHHIYPNRLIPFVVFFSIGVGTLLSSKLTYRLNNSP